MLQHHFTQWRAGLQQLCTVNVQRVSLVWVEVGILTWDNWWSQIGLAASRNLQLLCFYNQHEMVLIYKAVRGWGWSKTRSATHKHLNLSARVFVPKLLHFGSVSVLDTPVRLLRDPAPLFEIWGVRFGLWAVSAVRYYWYCWSHWLLWLKLSHRRRW